MNRRDFSARNEKPRVVLRADAGRTIGFGHFVRTCALAAYLRDSFRCELASFNPSGEGMTAYQTRMIRESGATPVTLEGPAMEDADRTFLALARGADITVLDNYYFSTDYQAAVRDRCGALVCIDDVHDRHFTADVVMTFCPLGRDDFSLEEYTRFYGGIEWSFLRAPFLAPSRRERSGGRISSVVTAMGGADPFRLTDKVIDIIRETLPDTAIHVIAGQTVEVSARESGRLRIWRNIDASAVAELFDSADLGIFPASTVCVEAFARRLPVAAGHYVDNQREFYARGVREGWFAPLGCLTDDSPAIRERLKKILAGPEPLRVPEFDFNRRRSDIIDIFKSLVK